MTITTHAHARAGLVGNPSDGYFGKTISIIVCNFKATVTLRESAQLEITPTPSDQARYGSIGELARDVRLFGYYGGMRLIKAAIKRFHDYCRAAGQPLHSRNFTIEYASDIPRLVGLAGSSALVTATFRALMQFYGVEIPLHLLPTLVLEAELKELGIQAGLQDRVIQAYEGIVYMDFEREHLKANGFGRYEPLRPASLPPLYIAYDPARAEVSDVTHRNLRQLFEQGDPVVTRTIEDLRQLTDEGRSAILACDWARLGRAVNTNFDLRTRIMAIAPENMRMVQAARAAGASASFTGSGGAIVGLWQDEAQFQRLVAALGEIGCSVIKPQINPA